MGTRLRLKREAVFPTWAMQRVPSILGSNIQSGEENGWPVMANMGETGFMIGSLEGFGCHSQGLHEAPGRRSLFLLFGNGNHFSHLGPDQLFELFPIQVVVA
jgi:hypothetical protein